MKRVGPACHLACSLDRRRARQEMRSRCPRMVRQVRRELADRRGEIRQGDDAAGARAMSDAHEDGRLLNRRAFLKNSTLGILAGGESLCAAPTVSGSQGETLYNGIRLPAVWPPHQTELPAVPIPPPYLTSPPEIIPIDVGRQLFVDDFLIAETTLERTFHAA